MSSDILDSHVEFTSPVYIDGALFLNFSTLIYLAEREDNGLSRAKSTEIRSAIGSMAHLSRYPYLLYSDIETTRFDFLERNHARSPSRLSIRDWMNENMEEIVILSEHPSGGALIEEDIFLILTSLDKHRQEGFRIPHVYITFNSSVSESKILAEGLTYLIRNVSPLRDYALKFYVGGNDSVSARINFMNLNFDKWVRNGSYGQYPLVAVGARDMSRYDNPYLERQKSRRFKLGEYRASTLADFFKSLVEGG